MIKAHFYKMAKKHGIPTLFAFLWFNLSYFGFLSVLTIFRSSNRF